MFTQFPRVLSLIPSSFATMATGRDVSITIFTASSLNSGEKLLFLGRVKIIHLSRHILMDGCPESSGHLKASIAEVAAVQLDAQIRALRLHRSVLAVVVKRAADKEEMTLMNKLARMSVAERKQMIDDFLAEV